MRSLLDFAVNFENDTHHIFYYISKRVG